MNRSAASFPTPGPAGPFRRSANDEAMSKHSHPSVHHRSLTRSIAPLTLLALLTSAALAPLLAQTAGNGTDRTARDVTLLVEDGMQKRIPMAFPAPVLDPTLSGALAEAAREAADTLRDDLEEARVFNIQGPTELSVLQLTGNRTHDFELYHSLGNAILLLVKLLPDGDKLVLEGRMYDLPSGQSITGKSYRGLVDQARRIAHRVADEIHLQFTGRPGIAQTTVVFHSDRSGHTELFLMDYDGRNQRQITGHRSTSVYAEWSPIGDRIAYLSYFSGKPAIYYVDLATSQKVPIYNGGSLSLSPTFSPEGRRVAFSHTERVDMDIFVCDRPCTKPVRLTKSRGIDTNPSWSPSGQKIAFTSDRSGRPNIYYMNADGRQVQRLSFDGEYNDGATWRPDGAQIAYASRRHGKFQIVTTDLVGLKTRVLTHGTQNHESPSYSPDGQRIAFTIQRSGQTQVYVMDLNGGNRRQLTHEGKNFAPDWSPYPR